jgi:peptidoglycan-associated lipoprotein
LLLSTAALLFLTGCPPKKKLPIQEKPPVAEEKPTDATEGEDILAAPTDIRITQDWSEIPALQAILFALDSASLDDGGRATLKKNVAILKKLPKSVTIRVEGHCDDRGTIEYNIALGQRRANAIRSYYVTAGLPGARLETISFGEERPVCREASEDCWAKNRRGVTKVKNIEAITIKAGDLK